MTYFQENIPESALREKMKRWGILRDEETDLMSIENAPLIEFLRAQIRARTRTIDVTDEILDLKKRVSELEKRVGARRKPSEVDYIYERFKEKLEKEHFGKIVAIDTDSKKIVGIGNTLLEAYNNAMIKTGKDQFDFRRVGYKYVHKV